MSELKPCPFCGGEPREVVGLIGCDSCGFGMPSAKKWNTRHTPNGWQLVPRELIDWIGGAQRLMRALPDGGGWPAAANQADMLLKAAPSPGQEE